MDNKLYEEYAVIDSQIKLLMKQKDELKAQIVEELVDSEEKSLDIGVGKFSITNLKTWTYTPRVSKLEEEFKALKATEQSTGDATYEEKPSLRFTLVKI